MILLKWLVTSFLIYFLYKRFFALPPPRQDDSRAFIKDDRPRGHSQKEKSQDEDEYIDFEEVD